MQDARAVTFVEYKVRETRPDFIAHANESCVEVRRMGAQYSCYRKLLQKL